MNNQKFSIISFYERRARRILPSLFFMLLCCLPFSWLLLTPQHLKDFSQSLVAVSSFSSNILFWSESGYFGVTSELKPLLHTWSLAVEEQYYVLFPLLLMILWPLRKFWILFILMVFSLGSLLFAHWGSHNIPGATFFLLPTRVWELSLGGLVAFYFMHKGEHLEIIKSHEKLNEYLGLFGFSLILYSIFKFDDSTPFPSFYALFPTIGTCLIIIFSSSGTIVGRFLGFRPIVALGLISYSAYLWHQPIFAFSRHLCIEDPGFYTVLILTLASIVLAYISWRFVETPFRDKNLVSKKNIFTLSFCGSVFFAAIGISGNYNNDYRWVGSFNPLNQSIEISSYTKDNKSLQVKSWDILREISGDDRYGVDNNNYDEDLWFDLDSSRKKMLIN